MTLFETGIRPAIDAYLAERAAEQRDYGSYWSASSAGYCMRKLIFERLGVPPVVKEDDARKTRVFEAGHVFHEWAQRITKAAGLSIAQELELQDEGFMVRGHIDDLVLIEEVDEEARIRTRGLSPSEDISPSEIMMHEAKYGVPKKQRLILYDYKTQHANAFTWQKGRPPSYYHTMQAGTYMYMLRKEGAKIATMPKLKDIALLRDAQNLTEARILKISKDDLRMDENQILWSEELSSSVRDYWTTLNGWWRDKKLPPCTCADREGGFMAKEKFNPYFYEGEPCSIKLYQQWKAENDRNLESPVA